MSVPDTNLIYCVPIQTYFVDKTTGAPLSAGVVTFYEDASRTTLKNIYQQSNTAPYTFTVLNNPITLSGVGTFQDGSGNDINVYLYPYVGSPSDTTRGAEQLYYVTVYSSGGTLQETRSAWPPNVQANFGAASTINSSNQITNSQFVEVLFETPTTFTVTGPNVSTEIAPGWFVLTSSTGAATFTVSQTAVASGVSTNKTGAPYELTIASASLDSLAIYQRITGSPLLLAGGAVYGYAQIASVGGTQSVSLTYEDSSGNDVALTGPLPTNPDNTFTTIEGAATVPIAATGTAPTAYVDFVITLVPNITFKITSVEMLSVANVSSKPGYFQQSVPEQTNGLYWYDKPNLEYKPIPSYLVGWDFALNPCQALGTSPAAVTQGIVNNSYYVADQTILFQSVDASFTMAQGQYGFTFTASNTSSLALVQYIPQAIALELLTGRMSIALAAKTNQTLLNGTVNLYWTATNLPPIYTPTFSSIVSSIASGPVTTVAAGWNAVPRTLGSASFTLASGGITPLTFSGFDATAVTTSTATFMAIVISFDELTAANTLTMQYCSLNSGDIATRPAPQTIDQVLRECQYYYQKSFLYDVVPATAAGINTGESYVNLIAQGNGPIIRYATPLRTAAAPSSITLYNPISANALIRNFTTATDFLTTSVTANTNSPNGFAVSGTQAGGSAGDLLGIHWVSDSRFGVV